jgi:hypothetical protein
VKTDQIRLGPEIEPGRGAAIRRSDEGISFGTFTEVKSGRPIPEGAELICVGDPADDGWRGVTPFYKHESNGPAQVATPAYHEGYDRIFGKKREAGLA